LVAFAALAQVALLKVQRKMFALVSWVAAHSLATEADQQQSPELI
jgi:hypothetical protein